MTSQTTPLPELYDELLLAAINCGHAIDSDRVVLHFDKSRPGTNALNQLKLRLQSAVASALQAQQAVPVTCAVCGEEEAFTGTCGGGRTNPRALCFAATPTAPAAPSATQPSAADAGAADAMGGIFAEPLAREHGTVICENGPDSQLEFSFKLLDVEALILDVLLRARGASLPVTGEQA